jgi:hypothetical protein
MTKNKDECCPKFNPKPWEGKTHVWKNKLFIRDSIPQLFHMPWPPMIGKMITKQWKKAEDAGAQPEMKDFLWLCYDPSPWKSIHLIHVTKKVPDADNTSLSGTFITKVFDGPYNDVPKWIKGMDEYLNKKGKKAKQYYFFFTACPKCIKKWGHNYVVLFGEV